MITTLYNKYYFKHFPVGATEHASEDDKGSGIYFYNNLINRIKELLNEKNIPNEIKSTFNEENPTKWTLKFCSCIITYESEKSTTYDLLINKTKVTLNKEYIYKKDYTDILEIIRQNLLKFIEKLVWKQNLFKKLSIKIQEKFSDTIKIEDFKFDCDTSATFHVSFNQNNTVQAVYDSNTGEIIIDDIRYLFMDERDFKPFINYLEQQLKLFSKT